MNQLNLSTKRRVRNPPTVPNLGEPKLVIVGVVGLVVASLIGSLIFADWWITLPESATPNYVGRQSCVDCHQAQVHAFTDSHHDLAMDIATDKTVLGDFDDVTFTHHDVVSRLFRDGERFMINTEGPSGELEDFEIKYVFGVEPLQQYMVEFDRPEEMPESEIARLQVLRISWDTEKQAWFYLPPPDVAEKLAPNDPLHWTGVTQCWNASCADCHSTNLQKNYDPESGIYHTTFSEIDVSCEACHGPGSLHVEMANSRSLFWDRKVGYGLANLKDESNVAQVEACAPCHSRRRVLQDGYHAGKPFHDYFAHELLQEQTYHADGQILDEVYVYGSFVQSKMYHQNIKCTDCHNPHTARVKFDGNQLCTSCHQHEAAKYDTVSHHHHKPGSEGASCVNCHMPETTYMEVDPRRDHSLRVPRPDLSVAHGTPNACSGCHVDAARLPAESSEQIKQYQDWVRLAKTGDEAVAAELALVDQAMMDATNDWYGERELPDSHTAAWSAARAGDAEALELLKDWIEDQRHPAIVRASSTWELARIADAEAANIALEALEDPEPTVVVAALARLEFALGEYISQAATMQTRPERVRVFRPLSKVMLPKLQDPSLLVRMEAARVLSRIPNDFRNEMMEREDRQAFDAAIEDLLASYRVSNDRAMAYVAMGNLYENLGRADDAALAYQQGIQVEPNTSGPRTNLSALLERSADEALRLAQSELNAGNQEAHQQLIEEANFYAAEASRTRAEELPLLRIDAERLPDAAEIQHRYGLALYQAGLSEEAEVALTRAFDLEPDNPDYVLILALFYERNSRWTEAVEKARALMRLVPNNPGYRRMLLRIENGQRAGRPLDVDQQP